MSNTTLPHLATDVRHSKFYFTDGNLVVRSAENAEHVATLFCVHKGVLAFNSPVFAGMFLLPDAAPGVQEAYCDVPLVQLTDSADDLEGIFAALYEVGALSPPPLDPNNPSRLSGVLAMANKYQMDAVRKRVVDILESSWPRSFEDWLRHESVMRTTQARFMEATDCLIDGKTFQDSTPEPASAVRIAEDHNVPSILPYAYYSLATVPATNDWDAARAKKSHQDVLPFTRTVRWNLLYARELRKVMCGKQWLIDYLGELEIAFTDYNSVLTRFAGRCSRVGTCVENSEEMVKMWKTTIFNRLLFHASKGPDPLKILELLIESKSKWGLCDRCSAVLVRDMRRRQSELWSRLPAMFSESQLGNVTIYEV